MLTMETKATKKRALAGLVARLVVRGYREAEAAADRPKIELPRGAWLERRLRGWLLHTLPTPGSRSRVRRRQLVETPPPDDTA